MRRRGRHNGSLPLKIMSDSRILSQYIALNHGPYCPGGRPSRARLGRESCYETTQFRAPLRERFLSGRVNLEMSPKEEKPNSGILESGSEFPPSYRASSVAGGFQEAMDKHRVIYCERSKSDDGILKRSLAFIKRISKRNSHLEVLGSQLDSLALCERNLESRRREFKKLVYGLDDRLSDEQDESEKRDLEASLDSFKYKYPIECSDKELSRARDYLKAPGNRGQVIAVNHRSNIELSIDLVQCLNSQQWLNDELINFYFSMLQERNDRQVAKGLKLKVWLWNSFFYSKLTSDQTNGTGYCYRNVSRWTQRKKIDLFDYDIVLLPINVNNVHWTLGMVDLKLGNIQYFDSLGGSFQDHLGCTKMSAAFFQNMSRYIQDEYMDKKKQKFPGQLKHLTTFSRPVPQQSNGSDCGVFTCMFAECLSEGRPFDFDTTRIDRIREIMLVECIRNEIS